MSPRVVIGAPVYNNAEHLPRALESLLGQTYGDLAVVLIDDGSTDETLALARGFAARDPRVHVHVNQRRIGMLENTRRAFELPLELFPDAELWALGSDHDVWDERWLEQLVAVLDAHPAVVLAYPISGRIDADGQPFPRRKPPWRFDSRGMTDPRARMRAAFHGMAAGDMIYGLFRVEPLRRVGSYRAVLVPDRLLLCELALEGEFAQVPELLWHRRFVGRADLERQRRAFFLTGAPRYAYVPWWLTHVAVMALEYGVRGRGRRLGIGRAAGFRLSADYLRASVRHRLWRRRRRVYSRILRRRDAAAGHLLRGALSVRPVRRLVRARVLPGLASAEDTLERLLTEAGRSADR